jgi:hypothetical protein
MHVQAKEQAAQRIGQLNEQVLALTRVNNNLLMQLVAIQRELIDMQRNHYDEMEDRFNELQARFNRLGRVFNEPSQQRQRRRRG